MDSQTEVPVLELVKIKSQYIPADNRTYQWFRSIGFPATRFHEDLIPTIKACAVRKGYPKIHVELFETILDKFMKSIKDFWLKHLYRDFEYTNKRLVFRTTDSKGKKRAVEKSLPRLEEKLRLFFSRWGLHSEFTYSEARSKLKLVVDFGIGKNMPIIQVKSNEVVLEPVSIELGNSKITTKVDDKFLYWEVYTKTGLDWVIIYKAKCLLQEVSDPTKFCTSLLLSTNVDQNEVAYAKRYYCAIKDWKDGKFPKHSFVANSDEQAIEFFRTKYEGQVSVVYDHVWNSIWDDSKDGAIEQPSEALKQVVGVRKPKIIESSNTSAPEVLAGADTPPWEDQKVETTKEAERIIQDVPATKVPRPNIGSNLIPQFGLRPPKKVK